MILFNNFKKRYRLNKKEIIKVMDRIFSSGNFILGKELDKLEKKLSKLFNIKHVIGVSSGTDALFLALKELCITEKDEVITTSHTAVPTISAIRQTGAMPILIDINVDTYNIDVELIEKKITKKTKAIVLVHLYGYPAEILKIKSLAKKYGLFLIEDVAQSFGAKYNNKFLGTFGDISCFSFYPTKILGTFGDAGAVVTNNKALGDKLRALRHYGEVGRNNSVYEGYNSRLDEVQAGLLSFGLTKLARLNKERNQLAKIYLNELKGLPIKLPLSSSKKIKRVWHLFVIQTSKRDKLQQYLTKHNIQTGIHYPKPIHLQKCYNFLKLKNSDLPVVSKISKEILSLPLSPELTVKEIKYVCLKIREFYEK
ncbi:DegT/DnrJ/EryC1/StrS family aminotransferase [bacterium]|nr:DegT/DnrJ/EryC1/StrS family aminotransferase [bacterium]